MSICSTELERLGLSILQSEDKKEGNLSNLSSLAIISALLWSINIICFNLAIQRIGVIFTVSLLMSAPVITMLLEATLLKHQFSFIQIIAALIVVLSGIGMIIVNNAKPSVKAPEFED